MTNSLFIHATNDHIGRRCVETLQALYKNIRHYIRSKLPQLRLKCFV